MSEWDRGYQDGNLGRDKGNYFSDERERDDYLAGYSLGNDHRIAYGYGNRPGVSA